MATLTLGYSPCPNDCFIFYALAHGRVAPELDLRVELDDIEALNRRAERGDLDVAKVSYHAFGHLADRYAMLRSGGALGRGVGPLVVTRRPLETLAGRSVAIPGGRTTANLLLRLSQPSDLRVRELRYDRIVPAVVAGEVDAGLIIHESRFTYRTHGLHRHIDLGAWWERETGLPIPLGGIAARRDLGGATIAALDAAVAASLRYAEANREETAAYIAEHAQELSPKVRQRHIDLYVNAFSHDLGDEGRRAVDALLDRGREAGLLPAAVEPRFAVRGGA